MPNVLNPFMLHALFELPLALICFIKPEMWPVTNQTVSSLVSIKMWAITVISLSLPSMLAISMPDTMPGKRAIGLGLMTYHALFAITFMQLREAPVLEQPSSKVTAEFTVMVLHTILFLLFATWWQTSGAKVKALSKELAKNASGSTPTH
ncbi:hypothetical protein BZG36_02642 [Bifiguratus adelaidae]|uniref:Uncharacterized protein n=1 Tax=Bifiguratus adelaidae TaxID=1938954 RepID=A0A261Y2T6_9FUNG|nr:hypothetical protein BZG36_02642 [Bifiguratus adelaidae]